MKNTHLRVQGIQSHHEVLAKAADRSTPIQDLFAELVLILERLKESPKVAAGGGSVEQWEDEEHFYLETDVDAIFDSEIDINVHDGRCYVRMDR